MEFTVSSPSNIAFIKYWGQRDSDLVLPIHDSFSMNLSACTTEIIAELVDNPAVQEMTIREYGSSEYLPATGSELAKFCTFYERARLFLKSNRQFGFRLRTRNTFPKKAGIASSASFFSAAALVLARGFEVELDIRQLSILARLSGSGSACRSIPDGFVWWHAGSSSETSYAEQIAAPEYWQIADVVVVVSTGEKVVSSQRGHAGAASSPYFTSRIADVTRVAVEMRAAFERKDFTQFGTALEKECFNFHSILMTQSPPLVFWSERTIAVIHEAHALRRKGIEVYLTIDAGENVHLICEAASVPAVCKRIATLSGVRETIVNYPAIGSRLL
ncbi:MAG: diphosphomevalonate decarboxylase [Patescibacteria group bacterium]|nr:diphosphomevalonate decarboxylase [Patescibacteria group bacterium]